MVDRLEYEIDLDAREAKRSLDRLVDSSRRLAKEVSSGIGRDVPRAMSDSIDRGARGANASARRAGKQAGKNFGESFNALAKGIVSTISFSFLAQGINNAINSAIGEERGIIALEIVAPRFGQDAEEAIRVSRRLAEELRIGPGAAAESLQNLLKSGLNLDQAADLLRRFQNEAAIGRSQGVSLEQAVQNLSFAYATNNSALGNLSGISENFATDILPRGKSAIEDYLAGTLDLGDNTEQVRKQIEEYSKSLQANGKQLNANDEEQAKYIGTLELTNLTLGAGEKAFEGAAGSQAELEQKLAELSRTIGRALLPAFVELVEALTPIIEGVSMFIQQNPELAAGLAIAALAVTGLSSAFFVLGPAIGGVKTALLFLRGLIIPGGIVFVAIAGLTALVANSWETIGKGADWVKQKLGEVGDAIGRTIEGLGALAAKSWETVGEGANWIKQRIGGVGDVVRGTMADVKASTSAMTGLTIAVPEARVEARASGGLAGAIPVAGIEARASGGPVMSGNPYLVGEFGPELFMPAQNGNILSNSAIRSPGGSNINNSRTINSNNTTNWNVNNYGGVKTNNFSNMELAI